MNSINEFAIIGEFGFNRFEGPWHVEKAGTVWTVVLPDDRVERPPDDRDEGYGVALVADGQIVGGGIVKSAYRPDGEEETHVNVDQYAIGD